MLNFPGVGYTTVDGSEIPNNHLHGMYKTWKIMG